MSFFDSKIKSSFFTPILLILLFKLSFDVVRIDNGVIFMQEELSYSFRLPIEFGSS